MSDSNFDPAEGDWDDLSSEPNWSESQWRNYLKNSDRDTARFLSIYNSLKDQPNHLDEAASLMGWDTEDISMTDDFSIVETEEVERPDENEATPYTLHRHPVFVVSRALYRYLHQSWEHFIVHSQSRVSPQLCWRYGKSLHQGETNVLLSIQAIDLGDFGLAICHLKNSLSAINETLGLLNKLTHPNRDYLEAFRQEIRIRIFDLRELWIRVMGDCRYECQRRSGGSE